MNHFSEMEWNWENIVSFGAKATESPRKQQLMDWMIVDDGEINPGPFNLSRSGGNSSSGSDGGHNSSAKSSISASTDSSTKDGIQTPNFRFSTFEGYSGNLSEKMEIKGTEFSGNLPPVEAASSVGSEEPLIGLKLGKRTYFENTMKSTPFTVMPTPSSTVLKKNKSFGQNGPVCCQVEGCITDLSQAKDYHRKHRVCDGHSKCPKVIVGGIERRFCQQCSRFHSLCEFDEKKRSCRRRLSDHNARRRKPQQETIQFNSTRLSSPYYGGTQQMGFLLNNSPLIRSRTPANSIWDTACNSKFTLTKVYPLKSNGDGSTYEQLHCPGIKSPRAINVQNGTNGLLASKNSTSQVFNPGSKGSLISSLDAAPDRALSLLSSNSWDSREPESIPLHHVMHENDSSSTHTMIHAIPEGVPLPSSEFWLSGQQSMHPHIQSLAANSNFQEIQLFRTPYEADFYSNILN